MEILLIIGAVYVFLCLLVGMASEGKGRSFAAGFFLSFFFTPILGGIIIGLLSAVPKPVTTSPVPTTEVKTCPQCAEEVKLAAKLCRHCGHVFEASTDATPAPDIPTPIISESFQLARQGKRPNEE